MAWDLRAALLKKGEIECARLDAFAFRECARTMRLLAQNVALGLDPVALAERIVEQDDAAILAEVLADRPDLDAESLQAAFIWCRKEARRTLIAEIGDPTPHRLA